MLFGLTLTKAVVILALALLLFGVPLMGFIVAIVERRKKKTHRNTLKGENSWER